jgi:predicted transcriptional regulator
VKQTPDRSNSIFFSIRLTPDVSAALRTVADHERNSMSTVARRLIAKGLARELRQTGLSKKYGIRTGAGSVRRAALRK